MTIPGIQQTSVALTAPVGINTTWKPDFSKQNPWEGMPLSYAGIATFKSTDTIAKPPWEDQKGAELVPKFGTPAYTALSTSLQKQLQPATTTEPTPSLTQAKPATVTAVTAAAAAAAAASFDTTKAWQDALNTRIGTFDTTKAAYDKSLTDFYTKWQPLTEKGTFTGSRDQLIQYNKEYDTLEQQRSDLNFQADEINARSKNLQDMWIKGLPADYQKMAKEQGTQAVLAAIDKDSQTYEAQQKGIQEAQQTRITVTPTSILSYNDIVISRMLTDRAKAIVVSLYYPDKYNQFVSKDGGKSLDSFGIKKDDLHMPTATTYDWLGNFKDDKGNYYLVDYLRSTPDKAVAAKSLVSMGFKADDVENAKEAAETVSIAPAPKLNIAEQAQLSMQNWANDMRTHSIVSANKIQNDILRNAVLGASGGMLFAASLVPGIAIEAARVAFRPEQLPSVVKDMGEGVVQSAMALNPVAMANPFDIAQATMNLGMIADMARGFIGKIVVYLAPTGMPAGEMMHYPYTTGEMPVDVKDIKEWAKKPVAEEIPTKPLDAVALGKAAGDLNREILKSVAKGGIVDSGEVPVGNTGLSLHFLRTPVQQVIGNVVFHGDNAGGKFIEPENLPLSANNPGIKFENTGVKQADTGTTVVGDLHEKAIGLEAEINAGYGKTVVSGNDWLGQKQTIIVMGDTVDRGSLNNSGFFQIRAMLDNWSAKANKTGGEVVQLVGNHDLAYLDGDSIKGVRYLNREAVRRNLLDGIARGDIQAAFVKDSKLYTHAGVSLDKFPEWRGKSADFIADDINSRFLKAVKANNYSDPIFDRGRVEAAAASSRYNGAKIGGPFWMRPQESTVKGLDLGYKQFVGHNPGSLGVRELIHNFVETDVHRWEGGKGVYYDTPVISPKNISFTAFKEFTAKKSGWYNSGWAALQFTQGGEGKPFITMTITDARLLKDVPEQHLATIEAEMQAGKQSTSDIYIRNAEQGLHNPSKVWDRSYEPEATYAGGSGIAIPPAHTGLLGRILAGRYADFFSYYNGKFIPIKVLVDESLITDGKMPPTPNIAQMYAIKLKVLENTFQNFTEAVKHPDMMLADIVQRATSPLREPMSLLGGDTAAESGVIPGVRNIYLTTDWGTRIRILAKSLADDALDILRKDGKDATEDNYRQALDKAYASEVTRLLRGSPTLAQRYNSSDEQRSKFEALYLTNLSHSFEAFARSSALESEVRPPSSSRVTSGSASRLPALPSRARAPEGRERTIERPAERVGEPRAVEMPGRAETRPPSVESLTTRPPSYERTIASPERYPLPLPERRSPLSLERYPPREPERYPPQPTPPKYPPGETGGADKKPKEGTKQPPVTLKQGFNWIVWEPPYRQGNVHWTRTPPQGATIVDGLGSAYRTIQSLGGDATIVLDTQMGFERIKVDKPRMAAGTPGTVHYEYAPGGRSSLTMKGVRAS